MALDATLAGKKYQKKISEEKFKKGVNAVTKNPATAALEQKDRFVKNTIAQKDRMIKNLEKVSLLVWKERTKEAFDKMQEKVIRSVDEGKWNAAKVLNAAKAARDAAAKLPRGTLEQSYERYIAAQKAIKDTWTK